MIATLNRFVDPRYTLADWVVVITALMLVAATAVSLLTAPMLRVLRMNAFTQDGYIYVDASIEISKTFQGKYIALVRDATTDENVCTASDLVVYRRGYTYSGPKKLDWWANNGECSTPKLRVHSPRTTHVYIETHYRLPGFLWGVLPDRWVVARTGVVDVPAQR